MSLATVTKTKDAPSRKYTEVSGRGVKRFLEIAQHSTNLVFTRNVERPLTTDRLTPRGIAIAGGFLRDIRTRKDDAFSDIDVFIGLPADVMQGICKTLVVNPLAFLSIGECTNSSNPDEPYVEVTLHKYQTHDSFAHYTKGLLCVLDPCVNDDYAQDDSPFLSFRGRALATLESSDEQLNIILQTVLAKGSGAYTNADLIRTLFEEFPCSLSRVAMGLFPAGALVESADFSYSTARGEVLWYGGNKTVNSKYYAKMLSKYPTTDPNLVPETWSHTLVADNDKYPGKVYE